MRTAALVGAVLVAATAIACGSSSAPASPSVTTSGGGGGVNASLIFVEGASDAQAFQPSPALLPAGGTVSWVNSDEQAHQIVATDGSFDTGVLAPDGRSPMIAVSASGAHYYCALHPSEKGIIRAADGSIPPCSGTNC